MSNISFTIGTLPTAAARWSGNCPLLSFTLAVPPAFISLLAVSKLFFDAAKCNAVCPLWFFALGSASLDRRRVTVSSPSPFLSDDPIMRGVQPELSCASGSKDFRDTRRRIIDGWLCETAQWRGRRPSSSWREARRGFACQNIKSTLLHQLTSL